MGGNILNKEDVTMPIDDGTGLDPGPFYHGTKAELKPADLIEPGYNSNYGARKKISFISLQP